MQLRIIPSLLIFIGSYLPLSLILLAQDVDYSTAIGETDKLTLGAICSTTLKNPHFSLSILFVCLVCFGFSLGALKVTTPKRFIRINEAKYIPTELMNYTLPYVVAFMSFDYQETGKFVGLIIFLGWMFIITHRAGQIILNPLLIVFGWRHYEIKYVSPDNTAELVGHALSKDKLEPEIDCKKTPLQDILIVKIVDMGNSTDDSN